MAMTGEQRRAALLQALEAADEPLTGAELAKLTGVSRQVVVQDMALLRTQGHVIFASRAGYALVKPVGSNQPVRLVKVCHSPEQAEEELLAIVDMGGAVLDVTVNHRVYGKVSASLNIKNRRDVQRFAEAIRTGKSVPLCAVTSGYHFHRIAAESEELLDEIEQMLEMRGFAAEVLPYEVGAI